jgi:disulfide bond formation protein DsbB
VDAPTFSAGVGVLAVIAALLGVGAVVGRLGWVPRLRPDGGTALTLAWGIATVAMLGSLVYSEVFHFVPCEYCWYQRILMYPLAVILGIAAWRGDLGIRRYAVPLAGIGAVISTYHVALQRIPALEASSCEATAPCTAIWVEALGFLTIPTMAGIGFLTIIALLVTAQPEIDE